MPVIVRSWSVCIRHDTRARSIDVFPGGPAEKRMRSPASKAAEARFTVSAAGTKRAGKEGQWQRPPGRRCRRCRRCRCEMEPGDRDETTLEWHGKEWRGRVAGKGRLCRKSCRESRLNRQDFRDDAAPRGE